LLVFLQAYQRKLPGYVVMNDVYLSLGSNIDAQKNMQAAIEALEKKYGKLRVSTIYESEAVGFQGDNFLNCVVAFGYNNTVKQSTALPELVEGVEVRCAELVEVLIKELKTMEDQLGRVRGGPKFSARTIDMDIILFGDLCGEYAGVRIPRDEITKNAYVLLPLMELAPDLKDPASGKSMKELWDCCCLDMQKQKLWKAEFQV